MTAVSAGWTRESENVHVCKPRSSLHAYGVIERSLHGWNAIRVAGGMRGNLGRDLPQSDAVLLVENSLFRD